MISNIKSVVAKAKGCSLELAQKIGAAVAAPSSAQIQVALFVIGAVVLSAGLVKGASASITAGAGISVGGGDYMITDNEIHYNDSQIAQAVVAILTYIEGSFGALVMVGAGIAAILSSAFGQYRAALGCLVVAVGAFILRSIMSTFFNTQSIDENNASV